MACLAEALAYTFLPSTCATCGVALPWKGSRAGVCGACWASVAAHSGAPCPRCGEPDVAAAETCLACRTDPPPWLAAASFGPYAGRLRDLVLIFKNGGKDELDRPLAGFLVAALQDAGWPRPDAVVAVPMRAWRRLRRGYNQAELLARAVAGRLGAPLVPALRRRSGGPQVGRARAERLRLSSSAFAARRRASGRVLLVDDVFTTGATASACSRSLTAAGAAEIYVLTLARTPRIGRIP